MNKLPDSILESCIIPLLPMREAVETSLISRRWRHLWRHSVLTRRNLEFDYPNVFGTDYQVVFKSLRWRVNDDLDKFMKEYMELYQGEKIDSLKVQQKSYLLPISTRNLDAWVRLAIAKGVEDIQLLLNRPYLASYVFPYQLLFQGSSSLKHLALCDCILRQPPPDFDRFSNLRSLSLSYVTLDQIFMAHLFSNCLLLESLKIKNCHGLSHLNVVGDRLSDLKLSHCGGIEISAPNLVSLEFCGDFSSIISVTTSPRLARILADVERMRPAVHSCLASFPELETLHLQYRDGGYRLSQISSDITFRNLKQLSLNQWQSGTFDHNLDHLKSVRDLITAAPLLEEFVLTEYTSRYPDDIRYNVECSGSFTHDHLKRVKLQRFLGNWYEIEFAIWIMKNAAKLEILVLTSGGSAYDVNLEKWIDVRDRRKYPSSWKQDMILLQEKLEQVKTNNARIIIEFMLKQN